MDDQNTQASEQTQTEADRRKFKRVALPLRARFLNEDGDELPCAIVNISVGGALLRAKKLPREGSTVVLYIDQVGRFESRVVRSSNRTFAVCYEKKRARNAKTADNLTRALNQEHRDTNRRKAPRIQQDKPAVIEFQDGTQSQCSILDISLTGASVEISPRPPLGTHITLGRMTAKVVRRHEKGIGIVFTGQLKKMEDVLQSATTSEPNEATSDQTGAAAPQFGKKGISA